MIDLVQAFSPSYAKARIKFLEAAATAGLQIESHKHPLPGKDGETLAMDVALQLPASGGVSDRLLIVSSASQGDAGFSGSGVQVFALHDAEWLTKARAQHITVLYVHAMDPYGFSYQQHTAVDDADLNSAASWSRQTLHQALGHVVKNSQRVAWLDVQTGHGASLMPGVAELAFPDHGHFTAIALNTVAAGSLAWQGQTISQARQALFQAVDGLTV